MPKLPQAADYGKRPSLRTNRLDHPGTGSQEFAQAAAAATEAFAAQLKAIKKKDDDLVYSLARNEIIEADLLQREALVDDTDFATHNERYSAGFKASREAIALRYPNMSPQDRALLASEADLIGARGGVAVRGRSREIEVDHGYASLLEGIEKSKENMLRAKDYETRNKVIEGQIEAIDAAEKAGYFGQNGASKAEVMRQELTQTLATASINAMSDEDQIRILSESLARRQGYGSDHLDSKGVDISPDATDQRSREKRAAAGLPEYPEGVGPGDQGSPYQADFAGGVSAWGASILKSQGKDPSGIGPVSKEELLAGGGSESIGDFIHADTAAAMLKAALGRDKENRNTIAAQEAFAEGRRLFPEDPQAVLKYVQRTTEGTIEEKASRMARQLQVDENNNEALLQRELSNKYSELLRSDPEFTYEMIPAEDKEVMRESTKRDLIAFEDSLAAKRGGFAQTTTWSATDAKGAPIEGNSWGKWNAMSTEEKLEQTLDSAAWKSVLTEGVWTKLLEEQGILKKPPKPINPENIMTNPQIFTSLMSGGIGGSGAYLPRTGRTPDEDQIWNRELFRFQNRVGEASHQDYNDGEVPYVARRNILLEMMAEKAWVRDASDFDELESMATGRYWAGDDLDVEHGIPAMTMTSKMRPAGFVHYEKFSAITTTMKIGEDDDAVDKEVTWPVWFKNEASNKLNGYVPNQKDMENAMYAEQQNLGYAEMLRRLGGGGEY